MPPDRTVERPRPDDRPALVSLTEKEALGYDQPEAWRNSDLQRLVNDNRAQIYSIVQPHVENALGRRVEMTGIQATYPYRAVEVGWRTIDEPLIAGSEYAFPEADGTLRSVAHIGESGTALPAEVVNGIYLMAYRDELTTVLADLLQAHPEFRGGLPPGYIRQYNRADPVFRISFSTPLSSADDDDLRATMNAADDAIYQAYLDQPDRTPAQWRELVDNTAADLPLSLSVRLVLADPDIELTEDLTRRLAEDVRDHPLLTPFGSWNVFTFSNLIGRDTNDFHREFVLSADRGQPEWWVRRESRDGGTVPR
jgi:hypothetical protein